VTCDECIQEDTVGSLSCGNTVADDKTYILAEYEIPSDGIVTGWEFCYQTSDVASVTIYPSIWRERTNRDYELIKSSNITFDPRNTTDPFSCVRINLLENYQIAVSKGFVIGLFSNTGSLLLHTDTDNHLTTYEYEGNQTMVTKENNKDVNFNIAIRAYLGK